MNHSRRTQSTDLLRNHLEQKKASLDATVDAMTQRRFLSPSEQLREKELKKRKLAMKDALTKL